MRADEVYVDTSALAKRYLNEIGSPEFDSFLHARNRVLISRLAVVELRCVLARRCRAGEIPGDHERRALADFAEDVAFGYLQVEPFSDADLSAARILIDQLTAHPLRTLDALHLAAALNVQARLVATADRVMARAAGALGLAVVTFGLNGS